MKKEQMIGAGVVVTCDKCDEPFDEDDRVPTILPDCAHTICSNCIKEILKDEEGSKQCPQCNVPIGDSRGAEDFKVNYKLLSLLINPGTVKLSNIFPCGKHLDKPIEYFCKACSLAVCVKCIYDEHNGHNLVQVEDMSNTIKQNITDLSKMIMNSRRLTEDNLKLLEQAREELHKLLSSQLKNIEQGFLELTRRLEEKKFEIVVDFENKYKREDQRLISIQNNLDRYLESIQNIEKIFIELIEFVDCNSDAQILLKVTDVTTFLHKSFTELENITKNQIEEKNEIFIQPNFRPMQLNTAKTLELIKTFEMIAPTNDQFNTFELKFIKPYVPGKEQSNGSNSLNQSINVRESMSLGQLGQRNNKPQSNVQVNQLSGSEEDANGDQSKLARRGKQGQQRRTIIRDEMVRTSTNNNNEQMNLQMEQRTKYKSSAQTLNTNSRPSSAKKDGGTTLGISQSKLGVSTNPNISDQIFMLGPSLDIYIYKISKGEWEKKEFEKTSEYQGGVKYFSLCTTPSKTFLTGGVQVTNSLPLQSLFEFSQNNFQNAIRKKNMSFKRYAHCSAQLKGILYVLGGFSHKDTQGEVPLTMSQCEKFNPATNIWSNISNMNESRSFFGCCAVDDQYFYCFGGFHDYQILSNVEKYDAITDTWISLYFKLPQPLAKLGAIAFDKRTIIILGGMSADYEPTNNVYSLDISSAKFTKKAPMRAERLMDGGVFVSSDKNIYVLNGCYTDFMSEKYNMGNNRWDLIPSHQVASNHKPINEWVGCIRQ